MELLPLKRVPPLSAEEPAKGMNFTQRTFVHVSGGMFAMIPHYSHGPLQHPPPQVPREGGLQLLDNSTPFRSSFTAYPPSAGSYTVRSRLKHLRQCIIGAK